MSKLSLLIRVVRHWHRLPEVVVDTSRVRLEGLSAPDLTAGVPVHCRGIALDDFKGPFQLKWFYDSISGHPPPSQDHPYHSTCFLLCLGKRSDIYKAIASSPAFSPFFHFATTVRQEPSSGQPTGCNLFLCAPPSWLYLCCCFSCILSYTGQPSFCSLPAELPVLWGTNPTILPYGKLGAFRNLHQLILYCTGNPIHYKFHRRE